MPVSFLWACDMCGRAVTRRSGLPDAWQIVYVEDPIGTPGKAREGCLCGKCWYELQTGQRGMADLDKLAAAAELPEALSFFDAGMRTLAEAYPSVATLGDAFGGWPTIAEEAVELATEEA